MYDKVRIMVFDSYFLDIFPCILNRAFAALLEIHPIACKIFNNCISIVKKNDCFGDYFMQNLCTYKQSVAPCYLCRV